MTASTRDSVRLAPDEALVRRIYWRRWAAVATQRGLDADEVYQEVWCALLNPRRAPFDPSRGSLSTWVYVVCRSVVHNVADGHWRRGRRIVLGVDADVALTGGG